MAAAARKAIHAYLSDEAHSGIHDWAAEQGVSVSGVLEAIGNHLAEATPEDSDPVWGPFIKAARKVDAQRRRRDHSSS